MMLVFLFLRTVVLIVKKMERMMLVFLQLNSSHKYFCLMGFEMIFMSCRQIEIQQSHCLSLY